MSAYDDLVERITYLMWDYNPDKAKTALAEVLRTLEEVTSEMARAANASHQDHSEPLVVNGDRIVVLDGHDYGVYLAMLRASAIQPPAAE